MQWSIEMSVTVIYNGDFSLLKWSLVIECWYIYLSTYSCQKDVGKYVSLLHHK